jgi:hypothetical protein
MTSSKVNPLTRTFLRRGEIVAADRVEKMEEESSMETELNTHAWLVYFWINQVVAKEHAARIFQYQLF